MYVIPRWPASEVLPPEVLPPDEFYDGDRIVCYFAKRTDVNMLVTFDYFDVGLFDELELDTFWAEITKNWLIMPL
jgi:hypothetical protein